MGAGVAMFDYDDDGYQDLFFFNGARLLDPMPSGASPDKSDSRFWNRMYRNNGDGTFTDVTKNAGLRGFSYGMGVATGEDRKSTRLNSSHLVISYAVFCLKKKNI